MNDREVSHVKYLLVWCQYLLVAGKAAPLQHYGKFTWKNHLKIFEWAPFPFGGFPNESHFFEIRPQNVHTNCVKLEKQST